MCFLCAKSCVHMLDFLEPGKLESNASVAPALPAIALLYVLASGSQFELELPPTTIHIHQADI